MAIRNVVQSGDPILKKQAKPVNNFDENLWELLDDMYQTMKANHGAGIAGPQVGILRQVCIVDINNIKLELVNPEIVERSSETWTEVEGCLSVKGVQGYVERPKKITVKAYDRYGNEYTVSAKEWLAKAICHETDHLKGILFTDIMKEVYVRNKKKGN